MSASLVGSEMCIRDSSPTSCDPGGEGLGGRPSLACSPQECHGSSIVVAKCSAVGINISPQG
eukprot:6263908-Alexandrium_andersonii.AAC.1